MMFDRPLSIADWPAPEASCCSGTVSDSSGLRAPPTDPLWNVAGTVDLATPPPLPPPATSGWPMLASCPAKGSIDPVGGDVGSPADGGGSPDDNIELTGGATAEFSAFLTFPPPRRARRRGGEGAR